MSVSVITVEDRAYHVSPDDLLSSDQQRVLAGGRLFDEITNAPVRAPVRVTADVHGLTARATMDGLFALAGVARRHLTGLATKARTVRLTFQAPGYLPLAALLTIPQTPGFPEQLPPVVDAGTLWMHRLLVVIAGRVVEDTPAGLPIGGATVRLTAVQQATSSPAFTAPNLVAVRPPLYFRRPITGPTPGRAGRVTLTPAPGPAHHLFSSVASGDTRLRLENRTGLNLAGGDWLEIEFTDPHATEIVLTAAVFGSSTADQPCEVSLAFPLQRSHDRGAGVRRVTASAPGADKALTREAIPGDSAIFVTSLSGWAGAVAVAVHEGPMTEHHHLARFNVTTNSEGFYRLPPLSRVAAVELEAVSPASTQKQRWSLDYGQAANLVNFRLQP